MPQRLLFTAALVTLSISVNAQDLEAILELNAATVDNQDKLSQVDSLRHRLHIKEPGFEVTGTYVATRSGNMRIDIQADEQHVFSEGLYEGHAWRWTPGDGRQDENEQEAAALRHGIEMPGNFYTIKEVRDRGATLTLMGSTPGKDHDEWQIRVELADGFSRDYFVDQVTHLVTRQRDNRAFHPGIDPRKVSVETRYDLSEMIDGVRRPMRQSNINWETGEWLGSTEVLSIEHNIEKAEEWVRPE